MRVVWAVEAITLSFSTELDFTDCSMGFGEIRLLKWCHVNDSNCFLAILNGFSEGLFLFQLIFFKKYLSKNQHFMYQILMSKT